MMSLCTPLIPKVPGGPLRVLVIGRISTPQQNITNVEASYEDVERFLHSVYPGPVEIKHLGEQGSGMRTDRATIIEAEEEITTGTWDLVLMEDLSRAYRNPRYQHAFVQDAVDAETRVICVGDSLDTADPNWEIMMGAATLRHGLYIPDTRRRVRRTATHSFHGGGMVQKIRYGYRRLTTEEAATGIHGPHNLRIAKIPECTATILEMRRRIMEGESYCQVAKSLQESATPTGEYVTTRVWTGHLVEDLLRDPILSGWRTFRDEIHIPVYKNGKHRRMPNPAPEREHYAALAHMSEEEQQTLWQVMDQGRDPSWQKSGTDHPRHRVARTDALWPCQHARCGICGGLMYSLKDKLKCQHALSDSDQSCWNHVHLQAERARTKIMPRLFQLFESLPEFRETLIDAAWAEFNRTLGHSEREVDGCEQKIKKLEKGEERLVAAITDQDGGNIPALLHRLKALQSELLKIRAVHSKALSRQTTPQRFATREDIENSLDDALLELSRTSFEFARLLRKLIPNFTIHPVQALDTNQVHPRARLTVCLSSSADAQDEGEPLTFTIEVDLFDAPLHIGNVERVRNAQQENPRASLKTLGRLLNINYMTVKRAADYQRRIEREGIGGVFRELTEKPAEASRWVPRKQTAPRRRGCRISTNTS